MPLAEVLTCFHKEILYIVMGNPFDLAFTCSVSLHVKGTCLLFVSVLLIEQFIDRAFRAGRVSCSVRLYGSSFVFVLCVHCSLAVQLECLAGQKFCFCSSVPGNALAKFTRLQNKQPFIGEKKRCFVSRTQKNIVKATAAKQLLLCSQKCPARRVCVTGPHNSASVEALLKPQMLNGECSLAGVSASRCVLYLRSYCFWSVPVPAARGTAFPPVQKTALASFQIILIPSLWSLCLSTRHSRKGLDSRNLTTSMKFLLLHAIILLGFMFWYRILGKK